jgi:ABC-type branched-subunit amino acid transport system substrate-binding protein
MSRISRRGSLSVVTIFAALLAACGGSSAGPTAKSDYIVYFSANQTGTTAAIGQAMLSASKGYIDYTNKHGGVKGHKIALTALDDAGDPSRVRNNIQQASTAGALVILGVNDSNAWSPNAPAITQAQIPAIGLGFTDAQLDPAPAFLYGLSASYGGYVQLQIALVQNLIKSGSLPAKPRVAFYHYTSTAVATMVVYQHTALNQNGWTFTTEQTFAQAPTDVSSQASAVAAGKPDVVLAEMLDSHAPLAVNTLRQKGYSGPIVNFTAGSSPATFAAIKDPSYYGELFFLNATWTDQPGIAEIQKRANEVNVTTLIDSGFYPNGWAAAAAAVAALNKCADPCSSAVKLNDALHNLGKVDVNGVNPAAGYSPTNHRLAGAGIYYHWDAAKGSPQPVGGWTTLT